MIFGSVRVEDAAGAILVHTIKAGQKTIRKGTVLDVDDLASLKGAGFADVMVARLESDDVGEDDAALAIAEAAAGANLRPSIPAYGRCNLTSTAHGLALIDRGRIDAVNAHDEGVSLATIEPFGLAYPGDLVATVKIVPFAVGQKAIHKCTATARTPAPVISIAAFAPKNVGLLQTTLPGARAKLVEKMTQATRARVEELGGMLSDFGTCGHDQQQLTDKLVGMEKQGIEIAMVLGASAIADRRDIVPAAIEQAGGRIIRFGMPVDPGHLSLFAMLKDMPILGVPGSARSPRRQGFDWLLQRLFAGLDIDDRDIGQMGVGGLLKDVPGRPMPRRIADDRDKAPRPAPRITALVLAAGQSRRMGEQNKLLAEIDGVAMVRRVVEAVVNSHADRVLVVTGHQAEQVRAALAGLEVEFVDNPEYAEGISASIRHGLAAISHDCEGVMVCLGDMPRVYPSTLDRLIASFDPTTGTDICVPVHKGKRGNPVLWGTHYFREMREIAGDVGAKHLIGRYGEAVREVAFDEDSVLLDVDSPDALAALRNREGRSS